MKVTFYGVRGAIPTPCKDMLRYGGNTLCVVVESETGQKLVLDAGSGLRSANAEFEHYNEPVHILLSHHHWDHIQGFPFFSPTRVAEQQVVIYPAQTNPEHNTAILDQMIGSYSAVKSHQLDADIIIKKKDLQQLEGVDIGDFEVRSWTLNHGNGGSAYRISCGDKVLVYAPLNELILAPEDNYSDFNDWVFFCQDADLLIHDAHYLDGEILQYRGCGHSCIADVVLLAEQAGVKLLSLFNHHPDRTDDVLDSQTAALLNRQTKVNLFFAKEGRSFNL